MPLLQLSYGRENCRGTSRPKDFLIVAEDGQPKDFPVGKEKNYNIYEGHEKEVKQPSVNSAERN